MSRDRDALSPDDLRNQQEQMRKESSGFLKSYNEFLGKWGTYQKSFKSSRAKPIERPKHTVFRATFRRSE